jgi:hypothetical protein
VFEYFWGGIYSQWYMSSFVIDGVQYNLRLVKNI